MTRPDWDAIESRPAARQEWMRVESRPTWGSVLLRALTILIVAWLLTVVVLGATAT